MQAYATDVEANIAISKLLIAHGPKPHAVMMARVLIIWAILLQARVLVMMLRVAREY